jgi:hypothetical protein
MLALEATSMNTFDFSFPANFVTIICTRFSFQLCCSLSGGIKSTHMALLWSDTLHEPSVNFSQQ